MPKILLNSKVCSVIVLNISCRNLSRAYANDFQTNIIILLSVVLKQACGCIWRLARQREKFSGKIYLERFITNKLCMQSCMRQRFILERDKLT